MERTYTSKSNKLALSGMIMALYIVTLYATQGFSFGAYQIRIATSLYGLGYFFPFLVLPLGLANLIANILFGGLGIIDIIGGCIVGMVTTYLVSLVRKLKLSEWFVIFPITLVPGLGVPLWLSYLLNLPYAPLALSLCIGQSICSVCSVFLIKLLKKRLLTEDSNGRKN